MKDVLFRTIGTYAVCLTTLLIIGNGFSHGENIIYSLCFSLLTTFIPGTFIFFYKRRKMSKNLS